MSTITRFLQELQERYPKAPIKKLWRNWNQLSYRTKKVLGFFESYVDSYYQRISSYDERRLV